MSAPGRPKGHDLLDQYTDDAIHDVVAYLWTLK